MDLNSRQEVKSMGQGRDQWGARPGTGVAAV